MSVLLTACVGSVRPSPGIRSADAGNGSVSHPQTASTQSHQTTDAPSATQPCQTPAIQISL